MSCCSAEGARCISGWDVEVGMIQHIEGFETQDSRQALVNWKGAGDLSIELIVRESAKRVPANVSVGSISRAGGRRDRRGTSGSDLSESGWIEIATVRRAGSGTYAVMKIDRDSGNQIWTVVTYVGE